MKFRDPICYLFCIISFYFKIFLPMNQIKSAGISGNSIFKFIRSISTRHICIYSITIFISICLISCAMIAKDSYKMTLPVVIPCGMIVLCIHVLSTLVDIVICCYNKTEPGASFFESMSLNAYFTGLFQTLAVVSIIFLAILISPLRTKPAALSINYFVPCQIALSAFLVEYARSNYPDNAWLLVFGLVIQLMTLLFVGILLLFYSQTNKKKKDILNSIESLEYIANSFKEIVEPFNSKSSTIEQSESIQNLSNNEKTPLSIKKR